MTRHLHAAARRLALVAAVLPALACASASPGGVADPVVDNAQSTSVEPPVQAPPAPEPRPEPDEALEAGGERQAAPGAPDPDPPPATCEGLTVYDCRRQEIERAGRTGKIGRLKDLVLDLGAELAEPTPTVVTTCWQHLKATALVELGRAEEAKTALELIVDSCPVWEALNNLAVLEAGAGNFGPAKELLREAAGRAQMDPDRSQQSEYPARNLQNLQSSRETPFLTLVGSIGECSEQEVPRADCESRITAVATLAPDGEEVAASFEVFRVDDVTGRREPVTDSSGKEQRFEVAMPSGTYVVAATLGMARAEEELLVSGGATVPVSLTLDAGRLTAGWRLAPGTAAKPAQFQVHHDGEILFESAAAEDGISLIVPAGPYLVEARQGRLSGAALRNVTAGAEIAVLLDSGIAAALEDWRQAWSRRDDAAYLRAYLDRFTPDRETSSAAWAEKRRAMIQNKSSIDVVVREQTYSRLGDAKIQTRFVQDYRSTPQDSGKEPFCSTGSKSLVFELAGEEWKISEESCAGCDDRTDCP